MNTKSIVYAILIGGLAGIFIYNAVRDDGSTPKQSDGTVSLLVDVVPQERQDRNLVDVSTGEGYLTVSDSLYFPAYSNLSTDNIFILDGSDMYIKVYDRSGNFVDTIGGGAGVGPGEISSPSSMDLSDVDDIWVHDRTKNVAMKFTVDSDSVESLSVSSGWQSMAVFGADNIIGIHTSDSLAFSIVGPDDSIINSFGEVIENQDRFGLGMIGWIDSQNDDLYYVSTFSGILLSYDRTGTLRWARTAIESEQLPVVSISETATSRATSISDNTPIYRSVIASPAGLMVLNRNPNRRERFIDVYELSNGDYKYSFLLDPPPGDIGDFHDGYLLANNDSVSVVYHLSLPGGN